MKALKWKLEKATILYRVRKMARYFDSWAEPLSIYAMRFNLSDTQYNELAAVLESQWPEIVAQAIAC